MKYLVLLLLFASCSYNKHFSSYVLSHKLSYDSMAVRYIRYVSSDPSLSEESKKILIGEVEDQEQMIKAAMSLLGLK